VRYTKLSASTRRISVRDLINQGNAHSIIHVKKRNRKGYPVPMYPPPNPFGRPCSMLHFCSRVCEGGSGIILMS
jgi:hypothetical protein